MNHLDKAIDDINHQRSKVREDFVKAYLAYNVKHVTTEVFNTLILVEQHVKPGIVTFKVMTKEDFEDEQAREAKG